MNLRRVFRISKWEAYRDSGFLSRGTLLLIVVSILVTGGVFASGGPANPDEGLYTVGVSEHSQYYEALEDHPVLRVQPPSSESFQSGRLDAFITEGGSVYAQESPTGRAAAHEIELAVKNYNERMMADEPNQVAAFPVVVSIEYITPESQSLALSGTKSLDTSTNQSDSQSETDTDSTSGSNDSQSSDTDSSGTPSTDTDTTTPTQSETPSDSSTKPTNNSTSTGSEDSGQTSTPDEEQTEENGAWSIQDKLGGDSTLRTPSQITPPLPFESLLISFVLLIPLNFISQVYASSMISERTQRRGELLLVSPASRYEIVVGKTLPYFLLICLITSAILMAVGAGPISFLGMLPLILAFLGLSFITACFARSYKELSFFTLGVSILLTSYAFIPAIFTQVHPISAISPLSIVVNELQGGGFDVARFLMGTIPLFITSAVIFVFGIGTYREEFLFTQVPLPEKLLRVLATQMDSSRSAFVMGALSIPFVFVTELLILAGFMAIPQLISIPLLLVLIAFIEEIGKSLPIYAAFKKNRLPSTPKVALITGALSGFGFFVAEKITVISQQVGINGLELGEIAFSTSLGAGGQGTSLGIALMIVWPVLHSITTVISCIGARNGRIGYIIGVVVATGVHVLYNLTAVMLYG